HHNHPCFSLLSEFRGIFYFFFSSRRRHTRSDRDWSSDVCSSDLLPPPLLLRVSLDHQDGQRERGAHPLHRGSAPRLRRLPLRERSEERRVGKESRFRCWRELSE